MLDEHWISYPAALTGELGWLERWRGESRLPGSAGNVEFFVRLTR